MVKEAVNHGIGRAAKDLVGAADMQVAARSRVEKPHGQRIKFLSTPSLQFESTPAWLGRTCVVS